MASIQLDINKENPSNEDNPSINAGDNDSDLAGTPANPNEWDETRISQIESSLIFVGKTMSTIENKVDTVTALFVEYLQSEIWN